VLQVAAETAFVQSAATVWRKENRAVALSQSRTARGHPLISSAAKRTSACSTVLRSAPLRKYWRSRPLAFSFEARCQRLAGSQKYTRVPSAAVTSACLAIAHGRPFHAPNAEPFPLETVPSRPGRPAEGSTASTGTPRRNAAARHQPQAWRALAAASSSVPFSGRGTDDSDVSRDDSEPTPC
jgi:hypothetical protein